MTDDQDEIVEIPGGMSADRIAAFLRDNLGKGFLAADSPVCFMAYDLVSCYAVHSAEGLSVPSADRPGQRQKFVVCRLGSADLTARLRAGGFAAWLKGEDGGVGTGDWPVYVVIPGHDSLVPVLSVLVLPEKSAVVLLPVTREDYAARWAPVAQSN
jgi:hypothetical protein